MMKQIVVSDKDDVQFDFDRMEMKISGPHHTVTLDFSHAQIQWSQVLFQTKRSSMFSEAQE
jgi:ribosomal protein L6P/L9E